MRHVSYCPDKQGDPYESTLLFDLGKVAQNPQTEKNPGIFSHADPRAGLDPYESVSFRPMVI